MKKSERDYDFINLVFAEWMLPGEWKTMECRTDVNHQEASYAMATKLHPNGKDYVDFWGNVNPYGEGCHLIFCTINEFSPNPTLVERENIVFLQLLEDSHLPECLLKCLNI